MAITIDTIWSGAASNLWTTAGNWSSGVPTTSQDIMIPAGNWNIDTTSMSDIQYGVLHIAPGFTGAIGTSGTPLSGSYTEIKHRGSGKLWFTDGSGTTTDVILNGPAGADIAELSGAISRVIVASGIATMSSAQTTLALLEVGAAARVILEANANAVTLLQNYGGVVESQRLVTTLDVIGGSFTQLRGSAQAIATANVYPGASLFVENGTTVTKITAHGGLVDFVRNRKDDLTVTTLEIMPGATVNEDYNLITVSNRKDWRN